MKTRLQFLSVVEEDLVALFGRGRLVRLNSIHVELRGGSKEDEIEAVGWIAMFMPDVVFVNGRMR